MKAYTHAGIFHADEVLATAILDGVARCRGEKLNLQRGFNPPEDEDVIVFDIGGGMYDHHSREVEYRVDEGVPYASAGLVWRDYGEEYVRGCAGDTLSIEFVDEIVKRVDHEFIMAVDARDNGFKEYSDGFCHNNLSFADIVSNYNPTWDCKGSHATNHGHFWNAVKFAKETLWRYVLRMVSEYRARTVLCEAISREQDHVVVLDEYVPWQRFLCSDPDLNHVWYVVYPSKRGGYNWQVVPLSISDSDPRCPVPEEWCGVEPEELQRLTGVSDATFCHRNGFLGACDSVQGCIDVVHVAMNNER